MTGVIVQRMRCRKDGCTRRFTRPQGSRRIYCPECSPPRKPRKVPVEVPTIPPGVEVLDGPIVRAVRADLVRCRAEGTLGGVIALRIARVLDDPDLGAAQVGSLSTQLQKTMAPILDGAPREPDELDAMRQRFESLGGGSA